MTAGDSLSSTSSSSHLLFLSLPLSLSFSLILSALTPYAIFRVFVFRSAWRVPESIPWIRIRRRPSFIRCAATSDFARVALSPSAGGPDLDLKFSMECRPMMWSYLRLDLAFVSLLDGFSSLLFGLFVDHVLQCLSGRDFSGFFFFKFYLFIYLFFFYYGYTSRFMNDFQIFGCWDLCKLWRMMCVCVRVCL